MLGMLGAAREGAGGVLCILYLSLSTASCVVSFFECNLHPSFALLMVLG